MGDSFFIQNFLCFSASISGKTALFKALDNDAMIFAVEAGDSV